MQIDIIKRNAENICIVGRKGEITSSNFYILPCAIYHLLYCTIILYSVSFVFPTKTWAL